MRIFLADNANVHAPSSSLAGFVSAYVAGSDGVILSVQHSRDGELVVFGQRDLAAATGTNCVVQQTSLADLRRLNIGATFQDSQGNRTRYSAQIMSLVATLRSLPADLGLIVRPLPGGHVGTRDAFIEAVAQTCSEESESPIFWLAARSEVEAARRVAPRCRVAIDKGLFDAEGDALRGLFDAVIAEHAEIGSDAGLTPFGSRLEQLHREGFLALGVIAVSSDRVPTYDKVAGWPFAWALAVQSVHAIQARHRRGRTFVEERFGGRSVNTEYWSFGYARVSRSCHVYQDDGVHVTISPWVAPNDPPPGDLLEYRLRRLEALVGLALRRTGTYTGGGVGLMMGVEGAFTAEADVTSARATQATMVELAATNVNPARHMPSWHADGSPRYPASDHEASAFFDPHGAPPFVGSEHDEDDGFRINSHLGSEYADNNYGSDTGLGTHLEVTLRLERRGPFFASYFRPLAMTGSQDWICSGFVRNDSMNSRVFLRVAGKRWQKVDPANPGGFLPVVPNHFTISRVDVTNWET